MKNNLTDNELYAYAAGILDGEGSVILYKDSKNPSGFMYRPMVKVVNTDMRVIDWFVTHFDGNVYKLEHGRKTGWRDCYSWVLYAPKEIEVFLRAIYPFVLIKLEQVQNMFSFLNKEWFDDGKQCYDKMRQLNQRGVKDESSKDVRQATYGFAEETT